MFINIVIGCVVVFLTTVVHTLAMIAVLGVINIAHADHWVPRSPLTRLLVVAALILMMFLATLVEAVLWAVSYLALGAISGVEQALYFSTVTYTTLGYGDVTAADGWKLLSAFEAVNGIIMFGWTTALIVAAVQRVYFMHPTAGGHGASTQ